MSTEERRAAAVSDLEAGRIQEGVEGLRELVASAVDTEHLNDLAVATQMAGDLEGAEALLRAARIIGGDRPDVLENLEAVTQLRAASDRSWRSAPGLAGHDPTGRGVPERAHPGMAVSKVLGEHCARYALALWMFGGQDVLDLGCGTGYGTEMLSWSARRVRGFDLWEPDASQRPRWPGAVELTYGHDLCRDPLPRADAATMFEVLEHLADGPAALNLAFRAVSTMFVSFPNPEYQGSHLNPHHVNDWSLDEVETAITEAAGRYHVNVSIDHFQQHGVILELGRDPEAGFWVMLVQATERMSH
jgi:hypothetical protein